MEKALKQEQGDSGGLDRTPVELWEVFGHQLTSTTLLSDSEKFTVNGQLSVFVG